MPAVLSAQLPVPVPVAADGEPCPGLRRELLADMTAAALDVLLLNRGICEAKHLVAYGFTVDQVLTHAPDAIRAARRRFGGL